MIELYMCKRELVLLTSSFSSHAFEIFGIFETHTFKTTYIEQLCLDKAQNLS